MPVDWNYIDTFFFVSLDGDVDHPGQKVEEITRAAVDGTAFRRTGYRADRYRLEATSLVADAAGAEALMILLKAKEGQIVTMRHRGVDYKNQLVLGVSLLERGPLLCPAGGVSPTSSTPAPFNSAGACWFLRSAWTMQYSATEATMHP